MITAKYKLFSAEPKASKFPRYAHRGSGRTRHFDLGRHAILRLPCAKAEGECLDRPGRLPSWGQREAAIHCPVFGFPCRQVLDVNLRDRATLHRRLVKALSKANELKNIIFVSTNYDIIIDNALTEENEHGIDLDYGVDFRNFDRPNDWSRPQLDRRVGLFKPHGSLNWLFCPTCHQLEITPKEKGVVTRLISDFSHATCSECP